MSQLVGIASPVSKSGSSQNQGKPQRTFHHGIEGGGEVVEGRNDDRLRKRFFFGFGMAQRRWGDVSRRGASVHFWEFGGGIFLVSFSFAE